MASNNLPTGFGTSPSLNTPRSFGIAPTERKTPQFSLPPEVPRSRKVPKKKRPRLSTAELERRFLSERYRGGKGVLEIVQIWKDTVLHIDQISSSDPVFIGEDVGDLKKPSKSPQYDVTHPSVGGRFILLEKHGEDWALNFNTNMGGFVVTSSKEGEKSRLSLDEALNLGVASGGGDGAGSILINGENRVKLQLGNITFLVHYVTDAPIIIPFARAQSQSKFLFVGIGIMLLLVGTFSALVTYFPERLSEINQEQRASDDIMRSLVEYQEKKKDKEKDVEPPEPIPELIPVEEMTDEIFNKLAHLKDETNVVDADNIGASSSSLPVGLSSSQRNKHNKASRTGLAANSKALASMAKLGGAGPEGLTGLAGFDGEDPSFGPTGLSTTSSGVGGNGDGIGGTIRGDDGAGDKWQMKTRYRSKPGPLVPERGSLTPGLSPGRVIAGGSYNKKQIKRVIRMNRGAIKNCYNKQLLKNSALKGRILIKWRISSVGTVSSVSVVSNEMGNDSVASCLKNRIKGWKFHPPKYGAAVDIRYPFNFESNRGK